MSAAYERRREARIARPWRCLPVRPRLESNSMPIPECGCHIWLGSCDGKGYGLIRVHGKVRRAHRVSWEHHYVRSVPRGLMVLHRCDVPSCINPLHLFLGTNDDNVADRIQKGRSVNLVGEDHGCAKINAEAAADILTRRLSSNDYASLYRITASQVRRIWRREAWGCLP
jgi:hypothetical protein